VPDGRLINADIAENQQAALLAGLRQLTTVGGALANYQQLALPQGKLSLVQSVADGSPLAIGPALDVAGTLQQGLSDRVTDYFAGDLSPTTDELVASLRHLSGTYDNLTVTVDPASVSGGLTDPDGKELQFNLDFQATRTQTVALNLGPNGDMNGLRLDAAATATLSATLHFNVTFGFDLTPGLSEAQAFFIRPHALSLTGSIHASNVNFAAHVGFLDLGVQNGTINLDGSVSVRFTNSTGNITLADLRNTPLDRLVTLTPTSSLNATFPVQAALGNFHAPANAAITVTAANVFATDPTVSLTGFSDLLSFNRFTPTNALGLLTQLQSWLVQMNNTPALAVTIPFAQDETLGKSFDFGSAFQNGLTNGLVLGNGATSFASAQDLAAQLATLLGLPIQTINPAYDPTTHDLSYHVELTAALPSITAPLGFNVNLGDLVGASSSTNVTLAAQASLNFTVGFNLTALATGETLSDKLFVSSASVGGTLDLSATSIRAAARFGFLQIQSSGGTAGITGATLSMQLKDPVSHRVGGRVTLTQLFNAVHTDLSSVVQGPTFSGSAQLVLPHITVSDNFLGTLAGNPTVTITVPNLGDLRTTQVNFTDFDKLLSFRTLGVGAVVSALNGVTQYLGTLSSFSFLNSKLPLLNRSISDLLGYASAFGTAVTQLQNSSTATVHVLAVNLRTALGLPADSPDVDVSFTTDQVLRLDVMFRPSASATLPLNLDLASLSGGDPRLTGVSSLVSAGGTLTATASATFTLHLGIDLHTPTNPVAFLYDDTGVTLSGSATGSNLSFSAGIGPLGIFVRGGTANLGATFSAGLTTTADHRHPLNGLGTSSFRAGLTGSASVTLPLYFPTDTQHVGDLGLAVDDLSDPTHTAHVTSSPDFRMLFDPHNWQAQLGVVINGLDSLLGVVQSGLNSQVFHNLPLVGDHLASTVHFIEDFRTRTLAQLHQVLDNAPQKTADLVKGAIFDALGPGALNILKKFDGSGGTPTLDDIHLTITATQVQFNLRLGQTYTVGAATSFDIGLPSLGLSFNGGVQVRLGWDFQFGFGVSTTDGFYFDTSHRNGLALTVDATLPGLNAQGRLLFLNVGATDNGSMFHGQFSVDLKDPGNTGKLTLAQLTAPGLRMDQIIVAQLTGQADVRLHFIVDFGSADFPSVSTDFVLSWGFSSANPGGPRETFGSRPTVQFNNVKLNLGSFFSRFVSPILNKIKEVIDPFKPVVDFLTRPIPVISDLFNHATSIVDLAQRLNPHLDLRFLTVVEDVYQFLDSIPSGGNIVIDFGDFDLGNFDLRGSTPVSQAHPNRGMRNPGTTDDQLMRSNDSDAPRSRSFVTRMGTVPGGGLQFPILQNPSSVFGLLLGQDVDLFTFDLPTLVAGFSFSQFFELLGPLGVRITGSVDVSAHLKFGYDTYGLRLYLDSHNVADLFEGFFVDQASTLLRLEGHLGGAVELDLVVVGAGIEGGINANVDFRLVDPDNDGKVRPAELLQDLESGNIFDVSGQLTAGLDAYAYVLGTDCDHAVHCWRYTLASVTLLDFNTATAPPVDHFFITSSPPVTAGSPATVTVIAEDSHNHPIKNYHGRIHFTSQDPLATLPGDYTFRDGDQGSHTFQIPMRTAGSKRLTVTDTANANATGGRSIQVDPGSAKSFQVTSQFTGTAGDPFGFTVTARDEFGNFADGYTGTVHFTSTDRQAGLPADYTFTSADRARHSFTAVFRTAGTNLSFTTADVHMPTLQTAHAGFTIRSAPASTLRVTTTAASATAGTAVDVTVTALDPYGNVAAGYRGTVSFTSSDPRALLPYDYKYGFSSAGVRNFRFTPKTSGAQSITAYDIVDANLLGSMSVPVNPAAAAYISLASPDSVAPGQPFNVTATLLDSFRNVVTGYRGTVHFTSSDAQAMLPGDYLFTAADQGVHAFSGVILRRAGIRSVTATDTGTASITGNATLNVVTGAVVRFAVSTSAANPYVAGTPFDVTVTAQDQYGNTVTSYTGTVHFSSADPFGATLPDDYAFTAGDAGVHTFPGGATLFTAGTWDVTATDTQSGLTGAASVTVQAAPAVAFQVVAPASATSGVAFDVTVIAVDPYGNTDTNYTGTVTFSTSDMDPGVVLPPDYTFQPSDQGMVTFPGGVTLITAGDQTLTATDTQSGITGTSTVTVTAGPAPGAGRFGARLAAALRVGPAAPAAGRPLDANHRAGTAGRAVASTEGESSPFRAEPVGGAVPRGALIDHVWSDPADLLLSDSTADKEWLP
jgi:hypothetical protein